MGLEVYYPTDIRNALLAAEQAANATATATGDTDDPFAAGYLAGYRAALTTLALAFGLDWRSFSGHSLRSGFITTAMDNGSGDSDIMQQTGHEDVKTMRRYRGDTGAGASRAVLAAFGVTE